nr:hypothetical protein [Coxiella endosymbiont of Ornithodoros amblus]
MGEILMYLEDFRQTKANVACMKRSGIRDFIPLIILLISINGMIGSARLFSPYFAAKTAGPAALVSCLVAG